MSVRSKALRLAILVSAFIGVSGCSVSGPLFGSTDEAVLSQNTENEVIVSDAGDLVAEEIDATAALSGNTSNLIVSDASDVMSRGAEGEIGLRVERGEGFSRVKIDTGASEPVFDVMMLSEPSRLVVDLLGQEGKANKTVPLTDNQFLNGIRVGGHADRTRLVFDLNEASAAAAEHSVDSEGGILTVTFLNTQLVSNNAVSGELGTGGLGAGSLENAALNPSAQLPELPKAKVATVRQDAGAGESVGTQLASRVKADGQLSDVSLDGLEFKKDSNAPGAVKLSLSEQAAFEIKKTAPSEYVLTIPGATASQRTTVPLIAPKGFPGLRSARAVQSDDAALVRMFVDPGTELEAVVQGRDILVKALAQRPLDVLAKNPAARAQLEAGAEPAAEAEGVHIDDETARSNPTGIRSADGSKIYTGRLISLDLQDTDIDNALRIIAEVSNLNIIASDDVTGKVTLRLIDVPWDQALDVILKTNGLDQVTEGNVIRIAPVNKLREEREALREAKRAAENLEDLTVQYIRVSYARVDELVEQVESVLSERGVVTSDERTNQLIIKDIARGHERSIELIKRLDLRTPQVLLETQIIEGQRNILRDLGFQWNFSYIQSPQTGNATGLNFPNTIGVGGAVSNVDQAVNFPAALGEGGVGSAVGLVLDSADGSRSLSARISGLETEGKVKVISRPQVATVNNKQAQIKSVETVRVRLPDSGTSIATGSGASASGGGRTAFEEIDVGIELSVTPQASPDYYVLLDVMTRSSTFGSTIVDNIPSTLNREATSTILVKSGQTFALGGVYRIEDSDNLEGVPFLKDVPFLGFLFRRSKVEKQDEELIFFITPHIVEGSFDPSLL